MCRGTALADAACEAINRAEAILFEVREATWFPARIAVTGRRTAAVAGPAEQPAPGRCPGRPGRDHACGGGLAREAGRRGGLALDHPVDRRRAGGLQKIKSVDTELTE